MDIHYAPSECIKSIDRVVFAYNAFQQYFDIQPFILEA